MRDLNAMELPELFEIVRGKSLDRLLVAALCEDLGEVGDVTSESIIDPARTASAAFVLRQVGVVCGGVVAAELACRLVNDYPDFGALEFQQRVVDGKMGAAGQTVAVVNGHLRAILAFERTALNIMGRMSGVATLTSAFVAKVNQTQAVICNTRKTMPGLRMLDTYAVRCGGGTLHRAGLFDAVLYKDNHLADVPMEQLCDVLTTAAKKARAAHELRFVEVEVDTLAQLKQVLAIETGLIDMVLLDNFGLDELRSAVRLREAVDSRVLFEASGGVTLNTVKDIAETGVDRISVGALTHGASQLDIGLDIQ